MSYLSQDTSDEKSTISGSCNSFAAFQTNRHKTTPSCNMLNQSGIAKEGARVGRGRKSKEIRAVLHLPDDKQALLQFEKTMTSFYTAQVEKRLQSMPKERKLEIVQNLLDDYKKI